MRFRLRQRKATAEFSPQNLKQQPQLTSQLSTFYPKSHIYDIYMIYMELSDVIPRSQLDGYFEEADFRICDDLLFQILNAWSISGYYHKWTTNLIMVMDL